MATTYATGEEIEELVGYEVTDAKINQAEDDLDDIAFGYMPGRSETAPFRKLDPDALASYKANGLKKALAEQIKYRAMMGDEFFVKAQRASGSADGVSYSGTLPHIGPRVLAILSDVGLVNRQGTFSNSFDDDEGWERIY